MEIKTITAKEVHERLLQEEPLYLIDVREEEEVALGMIPNAVHIPMGEIPKKQHLLDKNIEYILVCRSGNRSGTVCQYLMDLGYKVKNMVDGMLEWPGDVQPKQ